MIPRLGDGNVDIAVFDKTGAESLENDSPSRGRKPSGMGWAGGMDDVKFRK